MSLLLIYWDKINPCRQNVAQKHRDFTKPGY